MSRKQEKKAAAISRMMAFGGWSAAPDEEEPTSNSDAHEGDVITVDEQPQEVKLSDETSVEKTKELPNAKEERAEQEEAKDSAIEESNAVLATKAAPVRFDLARHRDDIGVVQKIHEGVPVIDDLKQLDGVDLSTGPRFFVKRSLVSIWEYHDRQCGGQPDVSDILESLMVEGQQEPAKARFDGKVIEVVAGFRRTHAVGQIDGMYVLIDLYPESQMDNVVAWKEMTGENNLERKKPVPIYAQVISDEKAIKAGIFKNRAQLSIAAGKNEKWSTNNKLLFEMVPEEVRSAAGPEAMATLTARDYKKLGEVFKVKREERVAKVLADDSLFVGGQFPVNKIIGLFSNTANNSKNLGKLSNDKLHVRLDPNGKVSISFKEGITESRLKEIVKLVTEKL